MDIQSLTEGVVSAPEGFQGLRGTAASLFALNEAAPFYILLLARDRLLTELQRAEYSSLDLDRLCVLRGRRVMPVRDVDALVYTSLALKELASSMSNRSGLFLGQVGAIKRFELHSKQFLQESEQVKYGGELVETPAQAEAAILVERQKLKSYWDRVVSLSTIWISALEELDALRFPNELAKELLVQSSDLVTTTAEGMKEQSPDARLESLHEAVLTVLNARAIVQGFAQAKAPSLFLEATGTLAPFTDAYHPGNVPSARSKPGWVSVYTGQDTLHLQVDGTTPLQLQLPGSAVAQHHSLMPYKPDGYGNKAGTIQFELDWNEANVLTKYIDSVTLLGPIDTPKTAAMMLTTDHVQGGLTFFPGKGIQLATVQSITPTRAKFSIYNDWTNIGPGDLLVITDRSSTHHMSEFRVVSVLGKDVIADIYDGLFGDEVDVKVEWGNEDDLRFYVRVKDQVNALNRRVGLSVLGKEATALGIFDTARMETQRTPLEYAYKWLKESSAIYTTKVVIDPQVHRVPATKELTGRSNTQDPRLLTVYTNSWTAQVYTEGTRSYVKKPQSGPIPDLNEVLVLRETYPLIQTRIIDSGGDILVMEDLIPEGTFWVEAGPSMYPFTDRREEMEYRVTEGLPPTVLKASGSTPKSALDVYLMNPIPEYIGPGNRSIYFKVQPELQQLVLAGKTSTELQSQVQVMGTGSLDAVLFPDLPKEAGTTPWVKVQDVPKRLSLGDTLELFTDSNTVPAYTLTVNHIDRDSSILGVASPVPMNLSPFKMDPTPVLPFARFKKVLRQNFNDVSAKTQEWLSLVDTDKLFRSLDFAINELLNVKNPTMEQVMSPRVQLKHLHSTLVDLGQRLSTYSADVVPDVDTLIRSLHQKGLDRAADILLSADFKQFFDLGQAGSSYLTALQEALQQVQVQDYPVRSEGRTDYDAAVDDILQATIDGTDFEYNPEQLEPIDRVDISESNSMDVGLPG